MNPFSSGVESPDPLVLIPGREVVQHWRADGAAGGASVRGTHHAAGQVPVQVARCRGAPGALHLLAA